MTLRCMRKTLHTLPLALAAAAHAATLHFRERDALRAMLNASEDAASVSRATDALVGLLAEAGPLFHRDIEERLKRSGFGVTITRIALKLAWERGLVSYLNETRGWNREIRKFALTALAYPDLNLEIYREDATTALIAAYFDRYGPASLEDTMWWSGLSRSAIVGALNHAGCDLVELHTSWSQAPLYMYREHFERFNASPPDQWPTGLNLLAHEDVALKAYFDTRRRYLASLPAERIFNQIGEVLPTIIYDGQVIGTWSWDERRHRVAASLVRGMTTSEVRAEVRHRAQALATTLRRGWSSAATAEQVSGYLPLPLQDDIQVIGQ
jgi:hypothetical protein